MPSRSQDRRTSRPSAYPSPTSSRTDTRTPGGASTRTAAVADNTVLITAALWRAYLASFLLNLPHTNALIRPLQQDHELREVCGFPGELPHRTTFNRFILRLENHRDLVEDYLQGLTDQLAERLPDFGQKVAVDSTVVRTHSNPNRKHVSDPEASWTAKTETYKNGKEYTEWYFGYKYHSRHGRDLRDSDHRQDDDRQPLGLPRAAYPVGQGEWRGRFKARYVLGR